MRSDWKRAQYKTSYNPSLLLQMNQTRDWDGHCLGAEGGEGLLVGNVGGVGVAVGAGKSTSGGVTASGTTTSTTLTTATSTTTGSTLRAVSSGRSVSSGLGELTVNFNGNLLLLGLGGLLGGSLLLISQHCTFAPDLHDSPCR